VYVAVTESLEAALEQDDLPDRVHVELVERLPNALQRYETVLQSVAELLATVHDDPTLELWRSGLTKPYRTVLPGWKGPGLAAVAEQTAEAADTLLRQAARRIEASAVSGALARPRDPLRCRYPGPLVQPVGIAARG